MRDRSQGFPVPCSAAARYRPCYLRGPRASSSHWPGSSAEGCRRGRSPITIPQPSPAALRRAGERGRVPDLRRRAVIRLRHPATEANASAGLATFQQLATTSTVKEHPGQQLAEQPDLRALDSSIGEAESATERRFAHLICVYAPARSVTALIARPAGPAGLRAASGHRGGGEMRACSYGRPGITWGVSCSMSWRARSSAIAASSGPAGLATSSASSLW